MTASILIALFVVYLFVGVALCIKGKLAMKIAYDTAIMATYGNAPGWKVVVYRCALRVGVVLGWPVFWLSS